MAHQENPFPWIGGSHNPFQLRWAAEAIVIGKVGWGKTTNLVPRCGPCLKTLPATRKTKTGEHMV